MVLKVGAAVPLVWRSPSSLQFGVDLPRVVLDDVDEGTDRLVAALVSGISVTGFDMMARSVGMPADAAQRLLARLEPVLERDEPATTEHRVVVSGDGPLADEVRGMLRAEGLLAASEASEPDREPDLAVVVAGWVIPPEDHGSWLRRDIPHLPVVVGDGGVTVGPLVEPGSGPCLYCVQLTRTDDDPAWPAIATQLWNRPAPTMSRLAVAESAVFVARLVRERLSTGPGAAVSWTVGDPRGSRAWSQHAMCRCAVPAESDWAPAAGLASPSSTRTEAVASVPA